MICGGSIRHLAAKATGIFAVLVMVVVMLVSSVGLPETHEADHPVVSSASCHTQVSCAPFIAPASIKVLTPNAVRKAKYAPFGNAASNLFGPAFETPPPRA
jgi:hypothetical protein